MPTTQLLKDFEEHLISEKIALKIKDQPDFFTGCNITTTNEGIYLNQTQFITNTLLSFHMNLCNTALYPHLGSFIQDIYSEAPLAKDFPYRNLIGSLIWICLSRLDIEHTVNVLSQFNSNPKVTHVVAAKHILRYLKGTKDLSLFFPYGDGSFVLTTHCDSDFATDTQSRRSRYGSVTRLNGTPISWTSKLQHSIATSSSDAEFFAICEAAYRLLHITKILHGIGVHLENEPPTLYNDNSSAIQSLLSENPNRRPSKKHIDVRFCKIRELIHDTKDFELAHVSSSDNLADILTKPMIGNIFKVLRSKLLKQVPAPFVSREGACFHKVNSTNE